MLYKLSANKPSFRDIVFSKGLNIVVAERTEASGNKASRNALGKTTFVEILDFCLGADFTKKSKLYSPNLLDWSFSLEMELAGYHFEVTRHINDAKKIYIHPFCKNFPLELKEQGDKQTYIDLEEWKLLLGKSLFDIDQMQHKKPNAPTARSILGYFIRKSGAYKEPFYTFKHQKAVQWQINNAFVLNLLWAKSLELHNLQVENEKYSNLIATYKSIGNTTGIFCYDLMLIEMYRKNVPQGIDFLIHDSTLYDAVDSRQRAKAIELANEKSNQHDFQYIFTINSDQLPLNDFSESFNYNDYVVKYLTDKDISGSLLGITFSSPVDKEVSEENL